MFSFYISKMAGDEERRIHFLRAMETYLLTILNLMIMLSDCRWPFDHSTTRLQFKKPTYMYETIKPNTVDIEMTLLEQMKYRHRVQQNVVKDNMTPQWYIVRSDQVYKVFDDAMKTLLKEHTHNLDFLIKRVSQK